MMNPVHARRDDDQIQNPFELDRQTPVGMMEERFGLKRDEEHDQHYRRDAKDQDRNRKKADGKNHFAEMEACGRAHVEVEVCVMYVMKTPEDRHHVISPMPPPV